MAQMLHTHPYRLSIGYKQQAESTAEPRRVTWLGLLAPHFQHAYRYGLKVALVFLVSVGFLVCASYIMASPVGLLVKLMALTAWACGFVPVSYALWTGQRQE